MVDQVPEESVGSLPEDSRLTISIMVFADPENFYLVHCVPDRSKG
jgi:hypothetical protein